MQALWIVLAIGVCVAVGYLGYRIEPHHVNKDATRFLTTSQQISAQGDNEGRRREAWIRVLPDGQLQIDSKRRLHREVTHWTLEGKAPDPPPRREVYVLRTLNNMGGLQRMTIKLPARSRAVKTLDELLAKSKRV
jgi:hypothetical protein